MCAYNELTLAILCILFPNCSVDWGQNIWLNETTLCAFRADYPLFLAKQQCSQLLFAAWLAVTITFATVTVIILWCCRNSATVFSVPMTSL